MIWYSFLIRRCFSLLSYHEFLKQNSLRNPACDRQFSSYRATFTLPPGQWVTVRLPWDAFTGYGPGPDVTPFAPILRRLGVVAIGEAKDVVLAVGKVGFYNVI